MSLSDTSRPNMISPSYVLSFLGILVVFISFKARIGEYGGGELMTIPIILHDPPSLFSGSKTGTYYELSTNNFGCRFSIHGEALEQVETNPQKKKLFVGFSSGDTVTAKVLTTDISFLHNPMKKVKIIGLVREDKVLIDPILVRKQTNKKFYRLLVIGLVALVSGLILAIKNAVKSSNS